MGRIHLWQSVCIHHLNLIMDFFQKGLSHINNFCFCVQNTWLLISKSKCVNNRWYCWVMCLAKHTRTLHSMLLQFWCICHKYLFPVWVGENMLIWINFYHCDLNKFPKTDYWFGIYELVMQFLLERHHWPLNI